MLLPLHLNLARHGGSSGKKKKAIDRVREILEEKQELEVVLTDIPVIQEVSEIQEGRPLSDVYLDGVSYELLSIEKMHMILSTLVEESKKRKLTDNERALIAILIAASSV